MLDDGTVIDVAQQLGQLLVCRIAERQPTVKLQHKRLCVETGQCIAGQFFQIGIHLIAQRIGRKMMVIGTAPQDVWLGLNFIRVPVIQHRAYRHTGQEGAVVFRQTFQRAGAEQQTTLDTAAVGDAVAAEIAKVNAAIKRRQ
ncbi:hypothetical protein D3C79_952040 [compost metagenome]